MNKDFNQNILENSKNYVAEMEKRILEGEILADVHHEDHSRILVTMTSTGKYGYCVFRPYFDDDPIYFAESDYLIEDLQKKTDYEGRPLLYDNAKSVIEKNLVGVFTEYRKTYNYNDFSISVKAPSDAQIQVTQQMAGYDSQYPVVILHADFINNSFYYGALAELYIDPETQKQTIRIGVGTLTPEGLPDVDRSIKMEKESQANEAFFGKKPLNNEEIENIIKKNTMQAQALLAPLYESVGLPMYDNVGFSPLLLEGLTGKPIDKYIDEKGNLLTDSSKK